MSKYTPINNTKDLASFLQQINKSVGMALPKVAEKIRELLKSYVLTAWYGRIGFSPSFYSRTYDYVNSIEISDVKMSRNRYSVSILFNTNKIRPLPPAFPGQWGRHTGRSGQDVSAAIPLFIEQGNRSPVYSYPGVAPVGNTRELAQRRSIHINELANLLRREGYIVKVN